MKKDMNNKILYLGALLLTLTFGSCRQDNDTLIPYDHNDVMAFNAATKSFAEQYKVFWNAMNQNYALWDYEAEQGLDWDAEYDKFLPQFAALDAQDYVSDKELQKLMNQMVAPLHDGHLFVDFKNYHSKSYVRASPSDLRNASRSDFLTDDEKVTRTRMLEGLYNVKRDDLLEWYLASTSLNNMFSHLGRNGITTKWINDEIARISNLTTPTEMEVNKLAALYAFNAELKKIQDYSMNQFIAAYNQMVLKYAYLHIPGLNYVSPSFNVSGISVTYALLKGNIAYLYLSGFELTDYLEESSLDDLNLSGNDLEQAKRIKTAWKMWFDKIQELHAAGTLGGVIIDLRCNGGGYTNDYQYVLGALLPSGGFTPCQLRYKRGTARLDYSPLMPQTMLTMKDEHATITEPIVLLGDCNSVSMSEITLRSSSLLPNAHFIGKRTWGGLCGLNSNSTFSINYSGYIGVDGETPVYAYVPMLATFSMDGKQLEGIGIDPEIEVDLDKQRFNSGNGDTQLERALQFIRTGN